MLCDCGVYCHLLWGGCQSLHKNKNTQVNITPCSVSWTKIKETKVLRIRKLGQRQGGNRQEEH